MEVLALLDILRRRWWLILLPVLAAFLLMLPSLPDTFKSEQSYTVGMRFTAAAPSDAEIDTGTTYEDSAYVPWLASEYVVVNLPQWVTSDTFAREVSSELASQGIEIPYEQVRAAFASDSARSILVVYINWPDSEQIEAIAEAARTVLQTRNQTYFPQFAANPADVVALDDIRVGVVATPLSDRFDPFVRLALALAIGIALAAAFEYFDDTVRTEADILALGMHVFGVVPSE
jgi:capsular polysaccharide biosynthesis protein